MQVTKALIFSLIYTLQASSTSTLTDSTSTFSSSSPSSSSQMALSQFSDSISLVDPVHKVHERISKTGMNKSSLPFDVLEILAKFDSHSFEKIIFNPLIPSLDKWIEASIKASLSIMFKNGSEKKRWNILIAINRWLIKQEQESLSPNGNPASGCKQYQVIQILETILVIIKKEKGNDGLLDLVFSMAFPETFYKFQLFCLDHYWRFKELYKNSDDVVRIKNELNSGYLGRVFNSSLIQNEISYIETLDQLKEFFKRNVPSIITEEFLLNPKL